MSDRLTELIRRLRIGVPMKPSRWSGDTHADDGGEYEIEQADALMMEAADALTEVQASRKLIAHLRARHRIIATISTREGPCTPPHQRFRCAECGWVVTSHVENPPRCPTIRMIDEAGL